MSSDADRRDGQAKILYAKIYQAFDRIPQASDAIEAVKTGLDLTEAAKTAAMAGAVAVAAGAGPLAALGAAIACGGVDLGKTTWAAWKFREKANADKARAKVAKLQGKAHPRLRSSQLSEAYDAGKNLARSSKDRHELVALNSGMNTSDESQTQSSVDREIGYHSLRSYVGKEQKEFRRGFKEAMEQVHEPLPTHLQLNSNSRHSDELVHASLPAGAGVSAGSGGLDLLMAGVRHFALEWRNRSDELRRHVQDAESLHEQISALVDGSSQQDEVHSILDIVQSALLASAFAANELYRAAHAADVWAEQA